MSEYMSSVMCMQDTVNVASRMESTAEPNTIHVSQSTYDLLPNEPWLPNQIMDVKGKGHMQVRTHTDSLSQPHVCTCAHTLMHTLRKLAHLLLTWRRLSHGMPMKTKSGRNSG